MTSMAEAPAPAEPTAAQAAETMRSRPYVGLLVVAAVIGVIVSLAAWCYLESVYQLQQELFKHLPHALGYDQGPPLWWSLPVLAVGALIVALAITRLPGDGGHVPAKGLAAGGLTNPIDLPGVILAGLAGLGFGLVLGPEGPLLALGSGLAVLAIRLARREMEPPVLAVIAAAGSVAALSFVFDSPLIAAVILIEATAIGGARLPLVLLPGLLAAGIGTLVSIGMGSFTGLSSHDYALGPLPLPHYGHPDIAQFGWTIALAIAVAVFTRPIMLGGLSTHRLVVRRIVILLPIVGLIIAGLAIAFHGATGKSVNEVLFSGQDALPGLLDAGRDLVAWRARAGNCLQGPGLHAVARELPRRPGVPGAIPRRGRRDHGLAPAWVHSDPGGRRRDGRRDRRGTAAAAHGDRARHPAHRQRRNRGRAAHHRRRRRRLPGHVEALRASARRGCGWR